MHIDLSSYLNSVVQAGSTSYNFMDIKKLQRKLVLNNIQTIHVLNKSNRSYILVTTTAALQHQVVTWPFHFAMSWLQHQMFRRFLIIRNNYLSNISMLYKNQRYFLLPKVIIPSIAIQGLDAFLSDIGSTIDSVLSSKSKLIISKMTSTFSISTFWVRFFELEYLISTVPISRCSNWKTSHCSTFKIVHTFYYIFSLYFQVKDIWHMGLKNLAQV